MRDLSPIIETVRQSDNHDVWLAVDITLSDNTTIRAAEIELVVSSLNLFGTSVSVTPTSYQMLLRKEPSVTFRRKETSGGDFSLFDLEHLFGALVAQVETILEGAKIVISTCWQKADLTFEADIYFIGLIEEVKADDEEVSFSVVADYNARDAVVADRVLTQRCIAIFGDNRCRKPAHLRELGETCSNIWDDAENGCLSKQWQFAYFGVPILRLNENYNANASWQGSISYGGGGGFSSDILDLYGCPCVDNFVHILKNKTEIVAIKAKDLQTGMIAIDALGNASVIDSLDLLKNQNCFELVCKNGSAIDCSETHPILRAFNDSKGTAINQLFVGEKALTYNRISKKAELSEIIICQEIEAQDVVRVTLSNTSNGLYNAGRSEEKAICGHNNKRSYEVYFDSINRQSLLY